MRDITPQPPPRPTDERPIFEIVIEDIRAKAEAGLAKYGTYLQASNGRDHLADAYQESIDQTKYLKAAIVQRAALTAALQEAEARLAMVSAAADYFSCGGHEDDCTAYASNPSNPCDCGWLDLHNALAATATAVAAFLDRVRAEGAAAELREWAKTFTGEVAQMLLRRAAELEGE